MAPHVHGVLQICHGQEPLVIGTAGPFGGDSGIDAAALHSDTTPAGIPRLDSQSAPTVTVTDDR
jgi:hypothetical protein